MHKKTVLFYRNFRKFTGGHLKVWHYYNHTAHSSKYKPAIAFSPNTVWNESNPWYDMRDQSYSDWRPDLAHVLFLAGMDWTIVTDDQRLSPTRPIINLIQGVRHADPDKALYRFLSHYAIRICVSEAVASALQETGRVNGPIFTIPPGLDNGNFPTPVTPWHERSLDILIAGLKQPALARTLEQCLESLAKRIDVLDKPLSREDFLARLNDARITLFLPHNAEGFYLPALEGFALGTLVICPDCIGNRTYCIAGRNCLQPAYNAESLLSAVQTALVMPAFQVKSLLEAGQKTIAAHTIETERRAFLDILHNAETIW